MRRTAEPSGFPKQMRSSIPSLPRRHLNYVKRMPRLRIPYFLISFRFASAKALPICANIFALPK
jgi:hypothetical protein